VLVTFFLFSAIFGFAERGILGQGHLRPVVSGAWLIKGLAAGLIMANIFHFFIGTCVKVSPRSAIWEPSRRLLMTLSTRFLVALRWSN